MAVQCGMVVPIQLSIYVSMCACVYECVYTECVYTVCLCVCVHTCVMHMCACACVQYIYVCVCVCMCAYMCVCGHIYICGCWHLLPSSTTTAGHPLSPRYKAKPQDLYLDMRRNHSISKMLQSMLVSQISVFVGLDDIENSELRLLQHRHHDYCHDIALEYLLYKTKQNIVHVYH